MSTHTSVRMTLPWPVKNPNSSVTVGSRDVLVTGSYHEEIPCVGPDIGYPEGVDAHSFRVDDTTWTWFQYLDFLVSSFSENEKNRIWKEIRETLERDYKENECSYQSWWLDEVLRNGELAEARGLWSMPGLSSFNPLV